MDPGSAPDAPRRIFPQPAPAGRRGVTRIALLIRTHYVDEGVRALIASLEHPDFDRFVLADERKGPLDVGGVPKIALGPGLPAELGLWGGAPNLMWRCGDYGLYAARQALPDHAAFWMIEPDVRIKAARPAEVLARFPPPDEVDFIAARLRPADAGWNWARTMDPAEGPIWRCLFPLVRLSARAIDVLHAGRRAASAAFVAAGTDPQFWPNDEVFTASALARRGLVCRDLNDFGPVYDEAEGFNYWVPVSERWVAEAGREGFAYHPVLSGQRYFMKLFRLADAQGRLDLLGGLIDGLIGQEWTAEEAAGHHRAVALALSVKRTGT